MTHHTDVRHRRGADDQTGGLEMEKWILRSLLLSMLLVSGAAVVASLDDIKRYVKISRM